LPWPRQARTDIPGLLIFAQFVGRSDLFQLDAQINGSIRVRLLRRRHLLKADLSELLAHLGEKSTGIRVRRVGTREAGRRIAISQENSLASFFLFFSTSPGK